MSEDFVVSKGKESPTVFLHENMFFTDEFPRFTFDRMTTILKPKQKTYFEESKVADHSRFIKNDTKNINEKILGKLLGPDKFMEQLK